MSKIVHQIAISEKKILNYLPPNKKSIEEFFPKHKHILWDYYAIKHFILKNNDNHVIEAIDKIKANAFKADIARYYILYKLGGWYTDLNNFFVSDPPKENYEMIFFRDVQSLTNSSWAVQVSLFYSSKNHHVLKDAITQSVYNVKNNYYGGHALCPTGPNLFGSIIAKHNLSETTSYLIGDMIKNKTPGFYFNNQIFAKYKPNNLKVANSGLPGNNNYEKIWNERMLY
jgi:mannosyltransferase OCH1-like enzyme